MSPLHTVVKTLGLHFDLGKRRLLTIEALIAGLVQARTVNLSHLAGHLPGPARHASKYRRLQRFFQFVRLDQGGRTADGAHARLGAARSPSSGGHQVIGNPTFPTPSSIASSTTPIASSSPATACGEHPSNPH